MLSINPFQFHADKISSSVYYFGCFWCWTLSVHRVLCCCWFFLFRLHVFLFQTFSCSIFSNWFQYLLSGTVLALFFDFVFFLALISYLSSSWFREWLWLVFCLCWTINHMVFIGYFNITAAFKFQKQKLSHLWIYCEYYSPLFWSQL